LYFALQTLQARLSAFTELCEKEYKNKLNVKLMMNEELKMIDDYSTSTSQRRKQS